MGTNSMPPAGFKPVIDPLTGLVEGWVVEATDTSTMVLPWAAGPIDLRSATTASLHFDSLLLARRSVASVQVSVDGRNWQTLLIVPASDDWLSIDVDLSPFAGQLIFLRFVFDAQAPEPGLTADSWLLRRASVGAPADGKYVDGSAR
jgi:hypothetical protein